MASSSKSTWNRASWSEKVRRTMFIRPRIFMEIIARVSARSGTGGEQGLDRDFDEHLAEVITAVVKEPWGTIAGDLGDNEVAKRIEEVERNLSPPERRLDCDTLRDARIALQKLANGELESEQGNYVAILNGGIVGSDDDETELRERLSREHSLPIHRFAVVYKGPWH